MKVELILPRKEKSKLVESGLYVVPLTLTQLAAVTPDNIELRLVDENLADVDYEWNPDLVGISVMTSQVGRAEEISQEYKLRGKTVIWGGIHPTVVDQSKNPYIDSFVVGEAEGLWSDILSDFKKGSLKRRYENAQSMDLNKVVPSRKRGLLKPSVDVLIEGLMTSRGCRFECPYCSASKVHGRRISWVSPGRVEKDVANMSSNYGAFYDDNLLNNKRYAIDVLRKIKKYNKRWFAELDPVSALDEEVAQILSEAGVKVVLIGFESVVPENLEGNKKYLHPSRWNKVVSNLHKYDIRVNGNFMVGFDNDGPDIFDKTKKQIIKDGIDFAAFSIVTPYPGTRLYERLYSRIFDWSWSNYDLKQVVFEPRLLTPEQLEEGTRKLREGYLPSILLIKDILQNC